MITYHRTSRNITMAVVAGILTLGLVGCDASGEDKKDDDCENSISMMSTREILAKGGGGGGGRGGGGGSRGGGGSVKGGSGKQPAKPKSNTKPLPVVGDIC